MAKRKSKSKQKVSGKKSEDITEQLEDAFMAGLGALENARKAGTKTFDSLVKQGEAYRKKTTNKTESLIREVQESIRGLEREAVSKASGLLDQVRETPQMEKLNQVFDSRVDETMQRLGIPRKRDLRKLNAKLDLIMAKLEATEAAKAPRKAKPAKRKAAKKAAKKTAKKTAKKAAKKTSTRRKSKPARKTARKVTKKATRKTSKKAASRS